MFGAGWLNLGSLLLGLIAWILPVVNLVQHNKADHRNWVAFSVASVSACAISLCMQIFYTRSFGKDRGLVSTYGYFPCGGIGRHITSCSYNYT